MRHDLFLVRSGERLVALPLQAVVETSRPLPIEPLPRSPGYVVGTSLLRGAPTPIVDLRLLLGETAPARARRLLGLRVGETRRVGILVDDVIGVREALAPVALSPLFAGAPAEVVRSLANLDGELLTLLEVGGLVSPETWAAVERGGGV